MSHQSSGEWAVQTVRNTTRLAYWTLAWLLSMALAVFGPMALWDGAKPWTIGAIGLNIAIGFGMILANRRHLKGLDELQQKIQLEAMAGSLGVGLVLGLAYSAMDGADLIGWDAEISHLVILMALTYLGGIVLGTRKYR
jgi:hypothetical protein